MKKTTILASAVMLALLSGCGGKDAAEHYQDAQTYIAQNKFNAAVIELKSAIQQAPDNVDYRFALGSLYLKTGDALSAEKELLLAQKGGISAELVAVPLLRATYLAENYSALLNLYPDTAALSAEIRAYVQLYQAMAELELGSADNALQLFTALADNADPAIASIAQSNLLIPDARYQEAYQLLENINTEHAHYEEALYLKANLQLAMDQHQQASQLLLDYIKLQPRQFKARLQVAQSLIKLEQYESAKSQLDIILKAVPDQPFANYLAAITALQAENYTAAKEFVDKAISKGYRTPPARLVAGVAAIKLGLESQALHHFSAVEQQLSAHPQLQRIYIALQLKESKTEEANKALLAMNMSDTDINLVAGTTLELVKKGNTVAARELVAKYESSMTDSAQSLSTIGQLKMVIPGEELAAMQDLERALLLAPDMHNTRLSLAASYLKRQQYDKVEELAKAWLDNADTANMGYNLLAYSALLQKDLSAAKAQLVNASNIASENPLTLLLRATIAQFEQDLPLATQLNNTLLQSRPNYIPALRQGYALARQQGDTQAILTLAKNTQQAEPANYPLRLAVANLLQLDGKTQEVFALLENQPADISQRLPQHWAMLIEAHINLKRPADALRLSKSWHEQNPASFQPAVIYANLLMRQNNPQEALTVVRLQQSRHPDNVQLRITEIAALEALKQFAAATDALDKLPVKIRDNAYNLALKGRLLLLQNKPAPALEALLKSYDIQPDNVTATLIADLYAKEFSFRKGLDFIEQHIARREPSAMLQSYYANLLMQSDPKKAQQIYASLVDTQAENFIFLNNYAWLLLNDGKLQQAAEYAKRAVALSPDNPDVLDTYGTVLLQLNETSAALVQFEKSLQLRPDNHEVKLNYAKALLQAGKTNDAGEVLNSIQSNDRLINQRLAELKAQLGS